MSEGEYEIILTHQAIKHIKGLPQHIKHRLREVLDTLKDYPIPIREYDVKKVRGENRTYRIRLGKYRLIYEIDEKAEEIRILGISHRKKAYR